MLKSIKQYILNSIKKKGWILIKKTAFEDSLFSIPSDFDPIHLAIFNKVKNFTMSSPERVIALCSAIDYICDNKIEGDIVECGVWKGGNIMAAIDTLLHHNDQKRTIYLYDTFEGMSEPGENDVKTGGVTGVGKTAAELFSNAEPDDFVLCYSALEEVKINVENLGYSPLKLNYVKGLVGDTIPKTLPSKISLLRLDICLYEPVSHVLNHLYPKLTSGGVIIISDYNDWQGTKMAVKEYIKKNNIQIFLNRIDKSGVIGIKP